MHHQELEDVSFAIDALDYDLFQRIRFSFLAFSSIEEPKASPTPRPRDIPIGRDEKIIPYERPIAIPKTIKELV